MLYSAFRERDGERRKEREREETDLTSVLATSLLSCGKSLVGKQKVRRSREWNKKERKKCSIYSNEECVAGENSSNTFNLEGGEKEEEKEEAESSARKVFEECERIIQLSHLVLFNERKRPRFALIRTPI